MIRPATTDAPEPPPHPPLQRRSLLPGWFSVRAVVVAGLVICMGGGLAKWFVDSRQARWDSRVADIASFVENERGLLFDHPVDVEFTSEANFISIFDTNGYDLDDGLQAEYAAHSRLYNATGLASDVDLFESEVDVAAVSSLGFYEPTEDRIYIRGTEMTPAVRAVVAHELTHALQAQHFDILLGGPDDLARRSIVEADATRVEERFVLSLSTAEQAAAVLGNTLSDEDTASLDEAPSMLVERQYAPYVLGPMLVADVFAAEGNAGVDELLRDPPTEAILIDPSLRNSGHVEVAPGIQAPTGAVVIEEPRQLSMLDTLAMLDAWLPWTQARGALDGWAGGGYVSYERGGDDPMVCFAVSAAFDGSVDAFVGAVATWADAAHSNAEPIVVDGRVEFEACDRGENAPEPPAPTVSLLYAISFEHSAVTSLGPDAPADAVAGMRCAARAMIDHPMADPLLVEPELSANQDVQLEQLQQAALAECGVDPLGS